MRTGPATSEAESSILRMGPSIGSDARPLRRGLAALGLACLSAFSATQADAEVLVDAGRDKMQVRVENDTVGHVLEALGQNVGLHYRSAAPLNKVIGGVFRVPWNTFCPAFSPVTILSSVTTRRAPSSWLSEKAARRLSRLRR